jgi:hypothetical protein
MGLRPTQGDEKRLGPATTLYEPSPSPLSSRAKPRDLQFRGPFVEMFFDRGVMGLRPTQGDEKRLGPATTLYEPSPSPCHPERTRISYFTALTRATYVVLPKENHMQLTEAATLDRKSGEAEGSAIPQTLPGNVFPQSGSETGGDLRCLPSGTGYPPQYLPSSAMARYRSSG